MQGFNRFFFFFCGLVFQINNCIHSTFSINIPLTERSKSNNCQHASLHKELGIQPCSHHPHFTWVFLSCLGAFWLNHVKLENFHQVQLMFILPESEQGKYRGRGRVAQLALLGTCLLDCNQSRSCVFSSCRILPCYPQKATPTELMFKSPSVWNCAQSFFGCCLYIWVPWITADPKQF